MESSERIISSPIATLSKATEPEGGSDSGVEVSCCKGADVDAPVSISIAMQSYRASDAASDNGSETSSYTSSNKSSSYRTSASALPKKRVSIAPQVISPGMSRSMTTSTRSRSSAREEKNTPPDSLPLRCGTSKLRTTWTSDSTPNSPCDGRWPSISMKTPVRVAGSPVTSSGTLPRRSRRCSEQVASSSNIRSLSASRDSHQNASSRKPVSSLRRTHSHRAREKTESYVQTVLSAKDFMNKDEKGIHEKLFSSVQTEDNSFSEASLQLVVNMRDRLQEELSVTKIELDELRKLCSKLQKEKEEYSMKQNQRLQDMSQQQKALEEESIEMYDFLQAERGTLVQEMEAQKTTLSDLKNELKYKTDIMDRQQKECRHLVRVSEQRRYENLALQSRLLQSRELLLQQGAMTSRAAVALVGLNNRLDTLVDSLSDSYDISANDLEEVVFYNEAYTQSSGDDDNVSQKENIKPMKNIKRNKNSFISAITQAIRSSRDKRKSMKDVEVDSTDFLDLEVEPELMMENVLEDVGMPTNTMLSSDHAENRNSCILDEDLHNLSLAILDHQRSESEDINSFDTLPTRNAMNGCFTDLSLVDRVINIDNALTKLLKILRIVQMETDSCLKDIPDERRVSTA